MLGRASLVAVSRRKDSSKQLSTKVWAMKTAHLNPMGIVAWHGLRCTVVVSPGSVMRCAMRGFVSLCRSENATGFMGKRRAIQVGRVMLWNILEISRKKDPGVEPRIRIASNMAGFGNEVWGGWGVASFCKRGQEMSLSRVWDLETAKRVISISEARLVYSGSSSEMTDQWSMPARSSCARRAMYSCCGA